MTSSWGNFAQSAASQRETVFYYLLGTWFQPSLVSNAYPNRQRSVIDHLLILCGFVRNVANGGTFGKSLFGEGVLFVLLFLNSRLYFRTRSCLQRLLVSSLQKLPVGRATVGCAAMYCSQLANRAALR